MTDSETSELQPLVRAYLASALKEIEWQVSPDLGSEWLAGEIVDHRHWQHLVAVVRADERAKVYAEATKEALIEARWQESRRVRGDSTDTRLAFIDRLLMLSRIFDSRALSASHGTAPTSLTGPPVLPVPDKEQQQ